MLIVHNDNFDSSLLQSYTDELYFRLHHSLVDMDSPMVPEHFMLCNISFDEYAEHINHCYSDIGITAKELRSYLNRPVYDPNLWIALKDTRNGRIAASGIGELDSEIGEGILEWIQVSAEYRRLGLGSYIVRELLFRMKDSAKFATVSGQCDNPSCPEKLYRKCGFSGNDIWHILKCK